MNNNNQIELYQRSVNRYYRTLRTVSGCGDRVQHYIDESYDEMYNAYCQLSEDEKLKVQLPKKEISYNDGSNGNSTGIDIGINLLNSKRNSEPCLIQ